MNTRKFTLSNNLILNLIFFSVIFSGCAARKNKIENQITTEERVDSLTVSASRQQAKIEELDAKIASIIDKMDSLKISLDNVIENKTMKTQVVGEIKKDTAKEDAANHSEHKSTAHKENNSIHLDDTTQSFLKGMKQFKAGKYSDAIMTFNRFTEAYPENILAGSAQFFTGECYFSMGEYNLASIEYEKTISTYPNSPRASSALIRLSQTQKFNVKNKESNQTIALAEHLFAGSPALELKEPYAKANEIKHEEKHPTSEVVAEKPAIEKVAEKPSASLTIEPMTGNASHETHEPEESKQHH